MAPLANSATMRAAIYADQEILDQYNLNNDAEVVNLLNTKTYQLVRQFVDSESGERPFEPGRWNTNAITDFYGASGAPSSGELLRVIDAEIARLRALGDTDSVERAETMAQQKLKLGSAPANNGRSGGFLFTRNGVRNNLIDIFTNSGGGAANADPYLELGFYNMIVAEHESQRIEGAARLAVQQDIDDTRDVDYREDLERIQREAETNFDAKREAMYQTGNKWGPAGIQSNWNDSMTEALADETG